MIVVGHPWDDEGAVSVGIMHQPVGTQACLVADIRLTPGNSGGPLADAHGNILGINCAIAGGLGCGATSDVIAEFLRKARVVVAA